MGSVQHVIFILISTVAAVLNGLLFFLVFKNRSLQTKFNFTILNACLADFLVSLQFIAHSISSMAMEKSIRGNTECTVLGFFHLVAFVGSVSGLAAVSFYRWIIICRPELNSKYCSNLGITLFNASVWIFTVALSCPPLLGWGRFHYQMEMSICFVDWKHNISYMIFMITVCFCGPIGITLLSVVFILKKRRLVDIQSDISEADMTTSARKAAIEKKKQKQRAESRITFSIILVAILFALFWGPFVVLMFLEAFSRCNVPEWIQAGGIILGCSNSIANPLVYLTLNSNFRNGVARLFFKARHNWHHLLCIVCIISQQSSTMA